MNAFVSISIPYLERYSDIERALELLSGDDAASRLHAPFHDGRAKRAIGLAFLVGDRERFSEVADAKTEYLTSINNPGLDSFLKLREFLEKRFNSLSMTS